MRLSIRAKQIAGVTAIVGVTVVVLSGLYLGRLAGVIVDESYSRAQILGYTILHRVTQLDIDPTDRYAALKNDSGLRSILEASIYDQSVTNAAIVDTNGIIQLHREPRLVGEQAPGNLGSLQALADADWLTRLAVIYSGDGQTLETRQLMNVGDEAFGSVRVSVSTLLMRSELNDALGSALLTVAIALIIAVFVAGLLAQVMLRPIHVIRSGLTRLGRGEFNVTLDLPPGDEFSELGTFFNTVSRQLSADRSQLADQKASLESLVEHLEDAVALFNPTGELLFTNPAMQATFPSSSVGQPVSAQLAADHPYRTLVEETLATRRSRGPVQMGDDQLAIAHAIAGPNNELVGILLVVRNLAYVSRMQSTIAYSRKLVALGRLTAGIAHEVKNPLNAMMIHLELLRTKIRKAALVPVGSGTGIAEAARPDDPLLQHVEVIETEIRRLDEVVQGFLKFTRPEDLRLQAVRISALIEEVRPILKPQARESNVRIVVETPDDQLAINGDSAMLRQAILNLALNACQAMPNGGTLRITTAPAPNNRVAVRVEDTGVGIPPEDLDRIFDLYFTTKDHGTGIGLSMVYRIVQMHDGEVEVQSTPGRGTTFTLLLPKAE
jgi:signal transduction histidine kinase